MPLTVTEKEHWRQRIAAKIERRIEALAAGDPGLMDRVKPEARRRAVQSLGLAESQAELDAVVQERKALDRREKRAQKAMVGRLQGVPADEVPESATHSYQFTQTVNAAVQKRQAVHEEELLAEHPVGRDVLKLRAEKENLLDVVWLATSPSHVRTLWSRVGELLGDEPSQLEREALAIGPAGEG